MEHVPTALLAPVREEGDRCARQAEEARELLLMACHDVCAPLSAIRLSAQSLRVRIAGGAALTEERLCEALERVEQLSDDAARLMSDLLRLERPALRRDKTSQEASRDVDLEDALATAISFHAEALRRARCTVVVVREEGVPRVRGRWARPLLESVFSNLLQNVGRHAAGARVTIDLRRAGGEVLIRFSDSGSDDRPGTEASAKSQGHGLGMWIVRRAVAELGGRLSIDARPGAGVSVEIALKMRGAAAPT